jgi:hypothetical protein
MKTTTTTIELPSRSIHLEGDEETIARIDRYLTNQSGTPPVFNLPPINPEDALAMPELSWGDPPADDEEVRPERDGEEQVVHNGGELPLRLPVLNFAKKKVKAAIAPVGEEALPLPA